jgi:hypothetical protein
MWPYHSSLWLLNSGIPIISFSFSKSYLPASTSSKVTPIYPLSPSPSPASLFGYLLHANSEKTLYKVTCATQFSRLCNILLPPFHNVRLSSIVHIHIDVNESNTYICLDSLTFICIWVMLESLILHCETEEVPKYHIRYT